MFSVGSEREAQTLIQLTCVLGVDGKPYARELVMEQTVENLFAFGDRLREAHSWLGEECTCGRRK